MSGPRALLLAATLALAAGAAAEEPETDSGWAAPAVTPVAPASALPEDDPCRSKPDSDADNAVVGSLDWTRRQLFSSVCVSARWFDRFFGEMRYDDSAARGVQGIAYYQVERRARTEVAQVPGLRLRVALPNLNKRLHVFVDRDDERQTIAGRSETVDSGPTSPVEAREDTAQLGFGYLANLAREILLKFRVGVRARGGQIEPFVQGQFRWVFGETDTTRWRLTETIFWRRSEGAGETTSLDFEAALRKNILFRWFNDATVSETTRLLRWVSGTSLYFDLGNRRAVQAQFTMNGDTGEPVDVANYGVRVSYRQSIGRPWLIGEAYIGHDFPKVAPGIDRLSQNFVGLKLELQFDRGQEAARPSAP